MTAPAVVHTVERGQQLYRRAKARIPGGTHLLSKRPEMFLPEGWPSYYASASGAQVVDLDGNVYLDMSIMGIGACVLGYADPDVDAAVKSAVDAGVACTLNAPEEVALADVLCVLHPWAQMVRYARGGGEAMAVAVRIARASTGRDKVAFCGYHGWDDWYLAANLAHTRELDGHLLPGLEPAGVPHGLIGTALPFHYNRIDELKAIVDAHRSELAAIVMEPQRGQEPAPGFLAEVRDIANETGAVLVFDEVTSGFRVTTGGIHLRLGVEPDMAVFAKAMANGYAMAAVIGTEAVMQAAQATFISSTNWTERIGPTAALATIRKFQEERVAGHLAAISAAVERAWRSASVRAGLQISVDGIPSLIHFSFDSPHEQATTTLFTQLMLERGFLAWNQFKASYAHDHGMVERYARAVSDAFAEIAQAVADGSVEARLRGPVARQGFYRLA